MKEFIEKLVGRLEEAEEYEMEFGNYHASKVYECSLRFVYIGVQIEHI